MLVFTWNVNRNEDATRLALDYLEDCAKTELVVASLQEVPPKPRKGRVPNWNLPPFLEPGPLKQRGLQLWGPVGPGRLIILASHDMAMDGQWRTDSNQRMLYVPLCENQKKLALIAIHAYDRSNPESRTDFQRGSHAALTRRQIDEFWDVGRSLILFGDLNAAPTDAEITLREGLFFRSREELRDVSKEMRNHYGKPSPPLENLMRQLDGDPLEKTYYWPSSGLRYNYDQVIVSEDLSANARTPAVIQQISTISLISRSKQRPNKTKYSDHLPVKVTIQL